MMIVMVKRNGNIFITSRSLFLHFLNAYLALYCNHHHHHHHPHYLISKGYHKLKMMVTFCFIWPRFLFFTENFCFLHKTVSRDFFVFFITIFKIDDLLRPFRNARQKPNCFKRPTCGIFGP